MRYCKRSAWPITRVAIASLSRWSRPCAIVCAPRRSAPASAPPAAPRRSAANRTNAARVSANSYRSSPTASGKAIACTVALRTCRRRRHAPPPPEDIAQDIARFVPNEGDWRRLDGLAQEMWASGHAQETLWAPFALFERFPADEDGCGVFWAILHGIEALDGYEDELAKSLRRQPSEFGILLAGRMLNAGIETLDGASLVSFLQSIAVSPRCPASVAAAALRYLGREGRADAMLASMAGWSRPTAADREWPLRSSLH